MFPAKPETDNLASAVPSVKQRQGAAVGYP